MVPSSSVSGSLVPRPGNSIALRKSGGNTYRSDLGNESGPGAEESRKQVWVDTAPRPTPEPQGCEQYTHTQDCKCTDQILRRVHTVKELVSSSGKSRLVLTTSFFVYLRIQGNPLTSP